MDMKVKLMAQSGLRMGKSTILKICRRALETKGYRTGAIRSTHTHEEMDVRWTGDALPRMEKLPVSPTKAAEEVVKQASDQYNKGDFDTWSYEVLKNIEKEKEERRS